MPFRWSAVNNLFLEAGDFAADEWRAGRSPDEENAEREMRQFVWCVPVAPSKWAQTSLDSTELADRITDLPRGVVPEGTQWLTAAVDLGKYLEQFLFLFSEPRASARADFRTPDRARPPQSRYTITNSAPVPWILVAWLPGATCHIVDYGRIEVASEDLGVEQATMVALREFRALVMDGWPVGKADGKPMIPERVWIDSGYMTPVVYAFCRESGARFLPAIGRGAAQQHRQWYNRPTRTGAIVRHIGEGFHINYIRA